MVVLEVCLRESSTARHEQVAAAAEAWYQRLVAQGAGSAQEGELIDFRSEPQLAEHVSHVRACDTDQAGLQVYVHPLYDEEPAEETTEGGDGDTVAFQMWALPSLELDGLWESLLYDEEEERLKPNLLRYVGTAMRFSDLGVDPRVIACNRIVLLHGPPGTGKTSICKGLAQKLAIRLSHRYATAHLVEVNAHSLFSKWFSESGKMVMGMFQRITEMLEDGDAFVCVLIDEVRAPSKDAVLWRKRALLRLSPGTT